MLLPKALCRPLAGSQTHLFGSGLRQEKVERLLLFVLFPKLTGCEAGVFFEERIKRRF